MDCKATVVTRIMMMPMAIMAGALPGGRQVVKILNVITMCILKGIALLIMMGKSWVESKLTSSMHNA